MYSLRQLYCRYSFFSKCLLDLLARVHVPFRLFHLSQSPSRRFLTKPNQTNCNKELLPYLFVFLTIYFSLSILKVGFDWLSGWKGILCSCNQKPGGGYSPKIHVGVCGTLQESLALFQTRLYPGTTSVCLKI